MGIDLCRPFAAHCIGYPVVTLGFSLKSMISHHFRLVSRLIICICHLIQCTFVRVTH
ncbi:unnamed protein product [Schistosoma mattheei]|uniref:Macoilin n=1 Tax=Schistosoma mattheei TaxID=31246 RepID=A0A3P8HNC3_9TREM|nr:unnamed protein product [Schistosoma mattheei]